MLRRHKYSWTCNEIFAHKKNAGEEAKLRDTMFRLDKKYGLVKDSIRHEAGQIRTSLKNLRKSTGHSIEALPPTPFQLSLPRDNTFLTLDTNIDLDLNENSYGVEREFNDDAEYTFVHHSVTVEKCKTEGSTSRGGDLGKSHSVCEEHLKSPAIEKEHSREGHCSPNLLTEKAELGISEVDSSHKSYRKRTCDQVCLLPEIQQRRSLINTKQGDNDNVTNPRPNVQDKDSEPHRNPLDTEYTITPLTKTSSSNHSTGYITKKSVENGLVHQTCRYVGSSGNNTNQNKHADHTQTRSTMDCHSLGPVQTPFYNGSPSEHPSKVRSRVPQQREREKVPSKEKELVPRLRNTRTRCRTCLERYRQNREYERQRKLEHEPFGRDKTGLTPSGDDVNRNGKTFLVKDDDLDSLFAESEVLDFEVTSKPIGQCKSRVLKPKKGYSRARMDQLAEPRTGRHKKLLFSKQLIKKEMDDLTEKHAQPQVTEREKERLRIVESKIRMFLAVTLASVGGASPSSMVHIPQREDIMRVDISHL